MPRSRRAAHAWLLAVLMVGATVLTGCADDEQDAPMLAMPDLVGKPVLAASTATYDALHTSLVSYDLAPADRKGGSDWVVVATSPAAGEPTPKFTKVYAWVLKASEYDWFQDHPTMPKLPANADVAKLIGKGGLLAPVKDLLLIRYQPGKAPKSAKASPVDATAFTPDRGLHPDLATEPPAELAVRDGLLAAPVKGTVVAGSRPGSAGALRDGQYLVVLVIPKPPAKPKPPVEAPRAPDPVLGGSTGGTSGGGGGGTPSLPDGFPDIPNCPERICG